MAVLEIEFRGSPSFCRQLQFFPRIEARRFASKALFVVKTTAFVSVKTDSTLLHVNPSMELRHGRATVISCSRFEACRMANDDMVDLRPVEKPLYTRIFNIYGGIIMARRPCAAEIPGTFDLVDAFRPSGAIVFHNPPPPLPARCRTLHPFER